jgi:hypothetical protein
LIEAGLAEVAAVAGGFDSADGDAGIIEIA